MRGSDLKNKNGHSLVELVMGVLIIGGIAAAAGQLQTSFFKDARLREAKISGSAESQFLIESLRRDIRGASITLAGQRDVALLPAHVGLPKSHKLQIKRRRLNGSLVAEDYTVTYEMKCRTRFSGALFAAAIDVEGCALCEGDLLPVVEISEGSQSTLVPRSHVLQNGVTGINACFETNGKKVNVQWEVRLAEQKAMTVPYESTFSFPLNDFVSGIVIQR